MNEEPKKKYSYPYVPKKHQKPTACLCGKPGFRFRNGWVCERCDRIENINAGPSGREKYRKTAQPNAKYADSFRCGIGGAL